MKLVNMKINRDFDTILNSLLEDESYSSLHHYSLLLPKEYEREKDLYYWGRSYINQLFKKANQIKSMEKNADNMEKIQLQQVLNIIYWTYCNLNYDDIVLSFEEFIKFSQLLCNTFDDYNPHISREWDNKFETNDKVIQDIVNSLSYHNNHSEHPYSFEIDKTKLELLRSKIHSKMDSLLQKQFSNYHVKNYIDLVNDLSDNSMSKIKLKKYFEQDL